MHRITIAAGSIAAVAELNSSRTAAAVWEALPIQARGSTWGDEVYFAIPVHLGEEDPQDVVAVGDLGYWPTGHAFCVFFGPTPASRGSEIRPASPVNILGRIVGDAKIFRAVRSGDMVVIERAD
jgi:hypothetical protein